MSRQASVEGTKSRLEVVRSQIYNLERELHAAGVEVEFTEFDPEEQ